MTRVISFLFACCFFFVPVTGSAADGVIEVKSPHKVGETVARLESVLTDKGMTIFAKIDHAAGATKIGETLRPTTLLIFGNPKGGTPFMQCNQTIGIDLPLKALVWEDETGQVWLGYNDPTFIAARHQTADCPVAAKIKGALANFAKAATTQ